MKPGNTYDCIALKTEIQSRMLREFDGMSDEEQRLAMQHELASSESAVARKWRACRVKKTLSSQK